VVSWYGPYHAIRGVESSSFGGTPNQSINLYFRHMAHKKQRRQTGNIYNRYTYIKPTPGFKNLGLRTPTPTPGLV